MTKNKAKTTTILTILDEKLNCYYQKNNLWPGKIIMSKEVKDKIFSELDLFLEAEENCSWENSKDNYRGIPIEIKPDTFIELKGE
jgi:hypothetical protein